MRKLEIEELKVGQVVYMNPGLTDFYVLPDSPAHDVVGRAKRHIVKGEIVLVPLTPFADTDDFDWANNWSAEA